MSAPQTGERASVGAAEGAKLVLDADNDSAVELGSDVKEGIREEVEIGFGAAIDELELDATLNELGPGFTLNTEDDELGTSVELGNADVDTPPPEPGTLLTDGFDGL